MNRRGFFGALMGGIAAATGIRRLAALPRLRLGDRIILGSGETEFFDVADARNQLIAVRNALPGKTDLLLHRTDEAFALPGTAPWRAQVERKSAPLDAWEAAAPVADLPEVWPGPSSAIAATSALPPLAQVECLVDLFGASGDAAPSFAAALIGELVLTRLRLADLRRLHAPSEPAMAPAPIPSPEGIPS